MMDGPRFPLLRAGQGMEIALAGNAIEFSSTVAPLIVARITGTAGTNEAGATIYTWEEMSPDTTGSVYEVTRGGRVGDGITNPAYELNDAEAEAGTIVLLRVRGSGTESQGQLIYEFSLGGGGGNAAVIKITSDVDANGYYDAEVQEWSGVSLFGTPVKARGTTATLYGGTPAKLLLSNHYVGIKQGVTYNDLPVYLIPNDATIIQVVTSYYCSVDGLVATIRRYAVPNAYEVP